MSEEKAKDLAKAILAEAVRTGASVNELQWACGMAMSGVMERVGQLPVQESDMETKTASGGNR